MKKILALALISTAFLAACSSKETTKTAETSTESTSNQSKTDTAADLAALHAEAMAADKSDFPQLAETPSEKEAQVILKTSKGDMTITLFPEHAPLAVENFLTHAKNGYYDGLTFHRVIQDFMIQAGDPLGNGTGGESIWAGKNSQIDSGRGFKNEVTPYLYNIRGALAMANAGPDTNGSQFFINQNQVDFSSRLDPESFPAPIIEAYKNGGNPNLDGSYTVFGQVTAGFEVLDSIATVETDENDKPKEEVTITTIEIVKDYSFK